MYVILCNSRTQVFNCRAYVVLLSHLRMPLFQVGLDFQLVDVCWGLLGAVVCGRAMEKTKLVKVQWLPWKSFLDLYIGHHSWKVSVYMLFTKDPLYKVTVAVMTTIEKTGWCLTHNRSLFLTHWKSKTVVACWQGSLLQAVIEGTQALATLWLLIVDSQLLTTLCLSASNHRREMSTQSDTREVLWTWHMPVPFLFFWLEFIHMTHITAGESEKHLTVVRRKEGGFAE